MWYTFALFVHIVGAIGLFVAISLIILAFVCMRGASTLEQLREWAKILQATGKSMISISLVILMPAVYMVTFIWGFDTPWVMAAFFAFVALAIMGATINGRNIERIAVLAQKAPSDSIPDELRAQLLAPQLWYSECILLMLVFGILCLMVIKPDMLFSILILAGMLILGIILGTLAQCLPRGVSQKQQLV